MVERWRLSVSGQVQGVGFRPFVYRLAVELGLVGWVINAANGAVIEAQGEIAQLERFISRLCAELPPHALIDRLDRQIVPPQADNLAFAIRKSDGGGAITARMLPDLAVCPECLREMRDPTDRRYRYPFINCTHCGARYSIIEALPYDRPYTTMRKFPMCAACRAEYDNPLDRRFHAQPIACPDCGPQLALWDSAGQVLARRDDALRMAEDALRQGRIVALKGLGGFQLLVDARDNAAVKRLRDRKCRPDKPLAVMFPTLSDLERACAVSDSERDLLLSSAAPIVLLRQKPNIIAPSVAPGMPYLGAFLPYTPLHHLLLDDLGFPVVATSGNRSSEPICIDEDEALSTLGEIADVLLVHDRPIARPVDDSVAMVAVGGVVMLRRARGYAPEPVELAGADGMIAFGAQQKNTVAFAHRGRVFLSQHLGEMEGAASSALCQRTIAEWKRLYDLHPELAVCDLHPDYRTTRLAEASGLPLLHVQHHAAHVLAVMAEHGLGAPALGIAWDGTGYGADGTIWGGEWLHVTDHAVTRFAHLRPFPLPGGDKAAREPRRCALGALYAMYGCNLPLERLDFTASERDLLLSALERGINAPLTSSMGRLFDAAAAILGIIQRCSFEGQAAMMLEAAADGVETEERYPFQVTPVTNPDGTTRYMIEWNEVIAALCEESDVGLAAAKFHNTLISMLTVIAQRAGERSVILSGGCFQNRRLLEGAVKALRAAGFEPFWASRVPPNDGGIALGQIAAAVRERKVAPCV
jgi:hydrogenase maturation protein HypF